VVANADALTTTVTAAAAAATVPENIKFKNIFINCLNIFFLIYKMSFEEQIREWVTTDNKIKLLNDQIREQRAKRNALGENILSVATESNLQNSVIQITDGKLKFQNTKSNAPLTYKFLNECLESCLDEISAKQIIEFIKQKREVRYSQEVKRYYN
jgi:hypothetical protein